MIDTKIALKKSLEVNLKEVYKKITEVSNDGKFSIDIKSADLGRTSLLYLEKLGFGYEYVLNETITIYWTLG